MDLAVSPDTIGRYRVLGTLGRGGMGVVYRAKDERLDREVALKMLPDEDRADATSRQRLLVEARAAARIDHPHVCAVYEVGETDDGHAFVAMGCYEGETLRDRLRNGPLAPEEVTELGRQISSGLSAAHARGIVHRDLKPSNIFLCEGDRLTAKILDFGIAKVEGTDLTKSGVTSGTLFYAAPEQAQGRAEARSDLWSLGVVLYEALTGRRPFQGSYEAATLYAILHEAPAPLPPRTPEPLASVVMRLLEKTPEARYESAAGVEQALTGERPAPERVSPEAARPVQRSLWRVGAMGVGAVLALFALWAFWPASSANALPDEIHLAMLAFTPAASGEEAEAFANGLAEDLASGITQLGAEHDDLWVIPPSGTQEIENAAEAREAVGANLAMTGTLREEGSRVTLTLNLLDTKTSRQIRSEPISVTSSAIGSLEAQALRAISKMLGLTNVDASTHLARGSADADANNYYFQGLNYLETNEGENDLDRAVSLFERAIERDSSFAMAYARLGQASLKQYEIMRDSTWIGRAEAAGRRAVALDPGEPLAHVALSRLYRATGRYPLATREANEALRLDPASADALFALAQAREASGDTVGAEEALREAIQLRPTLWTGYSELGYFFKRLGRYSEAADQFAEMIRLAPENYRGYLARGAQYQRLGDLNAARDDYEHALERRESASVYSNYATMELYANQPRKAVDLYRRALSLDSTDYELWANLASAYSEVPEADGQHRDALRTAIRQADRILAINPNDASTLSSIAVYHYRLGNSRAAKASAQRAASLAPDNLTVQFYAAMALAGIGETDLALDVLTVALESGLPLESVEAEPVFTAVRDHPRFSHIIALGVPR